MHWQQEDVQWEDVHGQARSGKIEEAGGVSTCGTTATALRREPILRSRMSTPSSFTRPLSASYNLTMSLRTVDFPDLSTRSLPC